MASHLTIDHTVNCELNISKQVLKLNSFVFSRLKKFLAFFLIAFLSIYQLTPSRRTITWRCYSSRLTKCPWLTITTKGLVHFLLQQSSLATSKAPLLKAIKGSGNTRSIKRCPKFCITKMTHSVINNGFLWCLKYL